MIWIIDIDQTCANPRERFAKAGPMPDKSDRSAFQQWLDHAHDPSMLGLDEPNDPVRTIIQAMSNLPMMEIYYLTGRSEAQREATQNWLDYHRFPAGPLLMRQNDDWRGPHRYKSEHIYKLMDEHPGEQFVAIDDDYAGDCEAMYRNRKIFFLKVVV